MKYKKYFLRLFGFLLLIVGLFISFWWFYWIKPLRNESNWDWYIHHTPEERWQNTKNIIKRFGVRYAPFFDLIQYGDKELICRIMEGSKNRDSEIRELQKRKILCYITNQDLCNNINEWNLWWKSNKFKSQKDWIKNGFLKFNIYLNEKLTRENITALLKIIGKYENTKKRWISFNAKRWLARNGFDPLKMDKNEILHEESNKLMLRGLLLYSYWLGKNSSLYAVKPKKTIKENCREISLEEEAGRLKWALIRVFRGSSISAVVCLLEGANRVSNTIIFLLIFCGFILIYFSYRK